MNAAGDGAGDDNFACRCHVRYSYSFGVFEKRRDDARERERLFRREPRRHPARAIVSN
jgi:hypothetical protein